MRRHVDGKLFLVHTEQQVPMAAFLFSAEANRIKALLKNTDIECHIKEVHSFGDEIQKVFVLVYGIERADIILAYPSFRNAKNMARILNESGTGYLITATSCFDVMRKQTIGKYKLKYGPVVAGDINPVYDVAELVVMNDVPTQAS